MPLRCGLTAGGIFGGRPRRLEVAELDPRQAEAGRAKNGAIRRAGSAVAQNVLD